MKHIHTDCSRIQAVLVLVRIQQIQSSSSSEDPTNPIQMLPKGVQQAPFKNNCWGFHKAVQVLPMRIQQELSSHYQWLSNKHCPVITYHWRFCKPGITRLSEDSTKVAWVITSECSNKSCPSITSEGSLETVQVSSERKLSRYYQCGFNRSGTGITS